MKIISWNVNGLRAIYKRNFLSILKRIKPDILCLQEIKIQKENLPKELLSPLGYSSYFSFAEKKGYSGVLIYSLKPAKTITYKSGYSKFDNEGRFLRLDFGEFILINLYLPHGGRAKEKLNYKLNCYNRLFVYLNKIKNKKIILIGDFNIAREEIDLARPKNNKNNIMFTPEERKKIAGLMRLGFIDTFRAKNPNKKQYTWWPYMANCRSRNIGWRIDYAFINQKMERHIKKAYILDEIKGSDHCPFGIEI
jgi:exodeoxyribonuclease-3